MTPSSCSIWTSASSASASLTCSSRSRTRSAADVAHRRRPERFFFLRGGAGGGPFALRALAAPPPSAVAGVGESFPSARPPPDFPPSDLPPFLPLPFCLLELHLFLVRLGRRRGFLAQRPEALLDDRLLQDRPEVGRDPVDEQAGRELPDEGDEQERQGQEDHPLVLVGGGRHQQRRDQLRADVEDDQRDEHRARGLVGQVRDEEEARLSRLAARQRVDALDSG